MLESAPPGIADALRLAMRQVVASVAVVTAGPAEACVGMTATAVSMVSLDPPSLLVCVNRATKLHRAVNESGLFRIGFLCQQHCEIARAFGGQLGQPERFVTGEWEHGFEHGPLLRDALVNVACRLQTKVDFGSHTVFIGGVEQVELGSGQPLLYGDGAYRRAA